jgi:lysylphosphatidylglycerol synthetase-like protein (DUF2156 family)
MGDGRTDSSTTSSVEPEWLAEAPVSPRRGAHPSDYVLRTPWFVPVTLLGTAVLAAAMIVVVQRPPWGLLIGILGGSLIGLLMTLAAMAWAVAIVFADNARSGLWFVLFPPYMMVYAVRRWEWMAQPTVLFLCGVILAIGVPWGLQQWLKDREEDVGSAVRTIEARSLVETKNGPHSGPYGTMGS